MICSPRKTLTQKLREAPVPQVFLKNLNIFLYLFTFYLLACVFCRKNDDCPNKYGEKKTKEKWNLTVHYYCLVSIIYN